MLLPGKSWNLRKKVLAKMTKILLTISSVPTETASAKSDATPLILPQD